MPRDTPYLDIKGECSYRVPFLFQNTVAQKLHIIQTLAPVYMKHDL